MISIFHHHFFTSNILIVFLCEKFSLVIDSEIFQKSFSPNFTKLHQISPSFLQKGKTKGKILTKLHQISPNLPQKVKIKGKILTKLHQISPNLLQNVKIKGKILTKLHQISPNLLQKVKIKGKILTKLHQISPNFRFPPKGKNKRKNSHQTSPNFGRKGKTKGKILTKSQNMTKKYLYSNSSIIFLFFNYFTCVFFILFREEKFFAIIMFIYTLNLNF